GGIPMPERGPGTTLSRPRRCRAPKISCKDKTMLKLLLAISCAFLLPMAAGEAGAQSTPAVPWWAAIESPPAQLGLYGFIVDDLIPTVRACGPDDKFFCLAGFKGERKNGLNDGIAYYKASATDSFLGHPVRMAVVLEQSKVLAVVAVTGGA